MPDGHMLRRDEQVAEFTVRVQCESFCTLDLVEDALDQLPTFNGQLHWARPTAPDPTDILGSDELVLIVADKVNLPQAINRASRYRGAEQAHILVYLHDGADLTVPSIPGLVVSRFALVEGLLSVTQALIAPVIPQGLICIDWMDTRHVLLLDGQIVVEAVSATQAKEAIVRVVSKLRARAANRPILGLQASIMCSPNKLAMRDPLDLALACKEITGEEATLIVAAPFLEWPDEDYCEVRVIAKVGCDALPV